ncbi:hypothetical protein PPL_02850 [Heterostelium album PN500]|uniref:Uncharacterized protein n=1 Tax=Heterostelium pallidum (strain ATCC 26659 / Pp 5 / PN500) TaxID=670386 RepID=D3B384_HETP5|nr:hypothetical protein PPL_02850 [Heterostelium album PN500]EFA83782.1 hypothetical protein PPL_02850 [Heterostelium album PN500]|eukprot:XP_020435899.1 hypothetical protein PPL_02850 [Heterostelium album PN500]
MSIFSSLVKNIHEKLNCDISYMDEIYNNEKLICLDVIKEILENNTFNAKEYMTKYTIFHHFVASYSSTKRDTEQYHSVLYKDIEVAIEDYLKMAIAEQLSFEHLRSGGGGGGGRRNVSTNTNTNTTTTTTTDADIDIDIDRIAFNSFPIVIAGYRIFKRVIIESLTVQSIIYDSHRNNIESNLETLSLILQEIS